MNANYLALTFLDETYEEALMAIRAYKHQLTQALKGDFILTRESQELLDHLKGQTTKGHFNRGAE
jgi:hypothetical protein